MRLTNAGTEKSLHLTDKEYRALKDLMQMITDDHIVGWHTEDIHNMVNEEDVGVELKKMVLQMRVRQFIRQT